MQYKHITEEEREAIRVGLELGMSCRAIANELGRSHTSISREYKRNRQQIGGGWSIEYVACKADMKARKRASAQRRKAPLKDPQIFLYVREKLTKRWSPEAIAKRLTLEYPQHHIHPETIYRYIYSKPVKDRYKLWRYLTMSRPKRKSKGGRMPKRPSRLGANIIDLRPAEVLERVRPGDWETDNMLGVKRDRTALSVTVNRSLRYTRITRVGLSAADKTKGVMDALEKYP